MKPFNVGVIGIGDISDVYINNLKTYDVVRVVACAGRDHEKARRKADEHGLPKAYVTPQDLVSDPDIDIVLNLTLPNVHAELTMLALQAGKHVYTEKPLAAAFREGEKILALAKERGLAVCCAPDTFLGGRLQTCRKLIDDGTIGDVTAASAFVVSHGHEWFHPTPEFFYKPGAGPLLDIGPYYVTALVSLLGPATRCTAMAKRTFDRRVVESEPNKGKVIDVEIDTHVSGTIEFANGAIVTLVPASMSGIPSFRAWRSMGQRERSAFPTSIPSTARTCLEARCSSATRKLIAGRDYPAANPLQSGERSQCSIVSTISATARTVAGSDSWIWPTLLNQTVKRAQAEPWRCTPSNSWRDC